MMRYIIGISILTIGIIIVRALSNGKVLRKHQYAFWIVIPLYMMLMPFIKIDVPVADIGNTLFTSNTEVATQEVKEAVPSTFMLGNMETEQSISDNQSVVNHKIQRSSGISYEREHITDNHVDVSIIKTNKSGKIGAALKNSSILVSGILIAALAVYNTGFISYCKRNRKYIGRDPSSGLKIYSIRHKQTPFLLFNRIYVDNSSEKINDFVVCHEVSHYKHGDYLWVLIRYLVLFLNWYNPIIWLAFILSGRDCEYACDEEVMRAYGVDSYKEYARTLVGIPQQQTNKAVFTLSTGMRSGYKMMKKRIINLKRPANSSRKVTALSMAAILLVTSCSFAKTSDTRRVKADDPWFNTNIIEVKSGADENKVMSLLNYQFVGMDDNYYIIRTSGDYEMPPDDEIDWDNYNQKDYRFCYIAVIDRKTSQTVNTIDLLKDLTVSENFVKDAYYSNGIIIAKTNLAKRDYDPFTGELLATHESGKNDLYSSSKLYTIGGYEIEVIDHQDDGELRYAELSITAPDKMVSKIEIKKADRDVWVSSVLAVTDTHALIMESIGNKRVYYHLDLENNELTPADSKDYEWLDSASLYESLSSPDGMIYFNSDCGISRVNARTKSIELALDFNWCDLNIGLIQYSTLIECSDDRFVICCKYDMTNVYSGRKADKIRIIEFTRADKNPHAGKTVLELYAYDGVDRFTGKAIALFNQTNGKCFIEVSTRYLYSDFYDNDYDNNNQDVMDLSEIKGNGKLSNKLAIDIINGEGPDILMNVSGFNQLNNSNCLIDLSQYLKEYNSDKYFTNIIEGSKTDGVLYQLPISFGMEGIFTKAENVSNTAKGFTLEEYKKFVRETLNGNDPIVNGQTVYFSMLFSGMSDEFISNGKVDLSKPEFKELADYIKDNVPENGSSLNAWYSSCYAESPLLKCDLTLGSGCTGINDFYGMGMGITPYGRGVTMLGFPSVDGRGPLFIPTCSVAVSTHAVDSKACGEFVKLLLSDDIQNEIAMNDRFVLSREAFKNAGAVAVEYYSNGGSGSYGNRIGNKITMQDIEFIENIILGCSRVKSEDPDISMILIEEMPAYFLGQKDLDSVIKIAENRIQKVLDERG